MHFTIHFNTLDHFVAIGFESAVKIVKFYAGNATGNRIKKFGRNVFGAIVTSAVAGLILIRRNQ